MNKPDHISAKKIKQIDSEIAYQQYRGESSKLLLKNRLLRSAIEALSLKNFLLSTISLKIAFSSLERIFYNKTPLGRVKVINRLTNSKAIKIRRWAIAISNGTIKPDEHAVILPKIKSLIMPNSSDIVEFG